jgi:glutamate--cysteine ligase
MRPVCELLDTGGALGYVESLDSQIAAITDPELTPSARLLAELQETGAPFAEYGLNMANTYRDYFTGIGDEFNGHKDLLAKEAVESLQRQQKIEAEDELQLDEYLAHYYA